VQHFELVAQDQDLDVFGVDASTVTRVMSDSVPAIGFTSLDHCQPG